jgi:hypothetical protein
MPSGYLVGGPSISLKIPHPIYNEYLLNTLAKDSAYHFTSAATVMLRCALEAENADAAQECVASAKKLIGFLRKMKNDVDWDLADICLGHCEAVVEKLSDSHYLDTWRRNPHSDQQSFEGAFRVNLSAHLNGQKSDEQMGSTFTPRMNQGFNPEPGNEGSSEGACASHTNPGYFQDSMALGPTPGTMVENPAFPDLWQMLDPDGYTYHNF